jgi:hypothetical protein
VHFHPPSVVAREIVAAQGIALRPNKHTTYAEGFVRRFGGVDQTMRMVRKGADQLILTLGSRDAEQWGLTSAHIAELLARRLGIERRDAFGLVDTALPQLLAAGLVRRGFGLECGHCFLRDWYALAETGELTECHGCAREFQIRTLQSLPFHYTPNELARRFLKEGGAAVLMAAAMIDQMDDSALVAFGGNLLRDAASQPFAEADLLWISRTVLGVVECKSFGTVDEAVLKDEQFRDISESLERGVNAAAAIKADVLVLALSTPADASEVKRMVGDMAARGRTLQVGVHLFLNGALHESGTGQPITGRDLHFVNPRALVATRPSPDEPVFVGAEVPPKPVELGAAARLLDLQKRWDAEMRTQPEPEPDVGDET